MKISEDAITQLPRESGESNVGLHSAMQESPGKPLSLELGNVEAEQ